jgi:hypothetical protein
MCTWNDSAFWSCWVKGSVNGNYISLSYKLAHFSKSFLIYIYVPCHLRWEKRVKIFSKVQGLSISPFNVLSTFASRILKIYYWMCVRDCLYFDEVTFSYDCEMSLSPIKLLTLNILYNIAILAINILSIWTYTMQAIFVFVFKVPGPHLTWMI